jgi:hypothetical protein
MMCSLDMGPAQIHLPADVQAGPARGVAGHLRPRAHRHRHGAHGAGAAQRLHAGTGRHLPDALHPHPQSCTVLRCRGCCCHQGFAVQCKDPERRVQVSVLSSIKSIKCAAYFFSFLCIESGSPVLCISYFHHFF